MSEELTEEVDPEVEEQVLEEVEVEAEAAPEVEAEAAPAFDWSYKFNEEVREVPEEYRWFDDAEKAEKLKDWYQASDALSYHKEQTATLKERLGGFEQQLVEWEPTMSQLDQVRQWYQEGDDLRALEAMGYDKDRLLKAAQKVIELEQMDPEQKRLYDQNRQASLEKEQLMTQNEQYQQQAEQSLANLTRLELDAALRDETAMQVADAYDAKHGAGKFRELVIAQGEVAVNRAGRHVPPSELVPQVVAQFAPFLGAPAGAAPQEQSAGAPKAKVIPNVKGKSSSIGRSAVSSIEDLHKLRQSKFGG